MTKETARAVKYALQATTNTSPLDTDRRANLAYLTLVLDTVRPLIGNLRGTIGKPADRIALALYVTLLQLAEAVKTIASQGPNIAVPTLARQALDAFVDLHNVLTHENYWKRLELADDRTWQKALETASAARNPFMKLLTGSGEALVEGRRLHAERIAEFERQGITLAEAKDRFRLAGMSHEYDSVWPMLSAYMHNNVSLLMSRHFNIEDGEPLQIEMQPEQFPYELPCIAHVGELLSLATEKVHQRFASDAIDLSEVHRVAMDLSDRAGHS